METFEINVCKGCIHSSHGAHCGWILDGTCKMSKYQPKEEGKT